MSKTRAEAIDSIDAIVLLVLDSIDVRTKQLRTLQEMRLLLLLEGGTYMDENARRSLESLAKITREFDKS